MENNIDLIEKVYEFNVFMSNYAILRHDVETNIDKFGIPRINIIFLDIEFNENSKRLIKNKYKKIKDISAENKNIIINDKCFIFNETYNNTEKIIKYLYDI